MLSVLTFLIGIGLLISGRQFFWLFIAAAGFLAGSEVAPHIFVGPSWVTIGIGVIFAIAGALLAYYLKKVAIVVSGFLMGSILLTSLAGMLGLGQGPSFWGFFLVGGIAGIIFISLVFDLALIWLSSLVGASLVIDYIPLQGVFSNLAFVAILFIGVLIQSSQYRDDEE